LKMTVSAVTEQTKNLTKNITDHISGIMNQPIIAGEVQTHDVGSGHHGTAGETLCVFFLFMTLILGAILRYSNKKYGIPYTPTLFFMGIFLGKFFNYTGYLAIEQSV